MLSALFCKKLRLQGTYFSYIYYRYLNFAHFFFLFLLLLDRHIEDQLNHYDEQVLVSLIDQKGGEQGVGESFELFANLFSQKTLKYIAFDFHEICKGNLSSLPSLSPSPSPPFSLSFPCPFFFFSFSLSLSLSISLSLGNHYENLDSLLEQVQGDLTRFGYFLKDPQVIYI